MGNIPAERIVRIEKAVLHGQRPRTIGYSARQDTHGSRLSDPVVRIHTKGGGAGIGK
jgi:hypothetical protein